MQHFCLAVKHLVSASFGARNMAISTNFLRKEVKAERSKLDRAQFCNDWC
jgi:hypothetical protein